MTIKCTILRVVICPFEYKLISYRYVTVPKQSPLSFNLLELAYGGTCCSGTLELIGLRLFFQGMIVLFPKNLVLWLLLKSVRKHILYQICNVQKQQNTCTIVDGGWREHPCASQLFPSGQCSITCWLQHDSLNLQKPVWENLHTTLINVTAIFVF